MGAALVVLHLSLIDGVGSVTIARLAQFLQTDTDWQQLYCYSAVDLQERFGLSCAMAENVYCGLADGSIVDETLALLDRQAILWASLLDDAYPVLLQHIHARPAIIYWKGVLPKHAIGIVGARKANWYARKTIDSLVGPLVEAGWVTISGGAVGADTMAHTATMRHNGATVAVLGSGLLRPYPVSNKRLFDAMVAKGGAVLSAFPLKTVPAPGNFPARNRIIAGMSRALIVAQAAQKSGARITAQHALEQGREVFAVPGAIDDPLSAGCHDLIRSGATLVHSARQLLEDVSAVFPEGPVANKHGSSLREQPDEALRAQDEQAIISCCSQPCSLDALVHYTGLSLTFLHEKLLQLQLQGVIEQNAVGMWHRV